MSENVNFWEVPSLVDANGSNNALRLKRAVAYLKNCVHEIHEIKSCIEDEFDNDYLAMDALCVELSRYIKPMNLAAEQWSK